MKLLIIKKIIAEMFSKEGRKRIMISIIVLIAIILTLLTIISYLLLSPLRLFSGFLTNDEYNLIADFKTEYGYLGANDRDIPLYIQTDIEWSSYPYAGSNIGIAGCGATSLAMVLTGLTGETVTPVDMASYSTQNGYAVNGIGTAWGLMTTGALNYIKENNFKGILTATQVPFTKESILEELSQGNVMITSMKKGLFTRTGHFIVLTGIDENGKITVNDSYSRDISSITFDPKVISGQTKGAWSYNYQEIEESGVE